MYHHSKHKRNAEPCQPRWEVTPWSECSMSCGEGVRMRTVRCWQMIGPGFDSTLYVEMCNGIAGEKPEETKPCRMLDQCGPQWETSDWSSVRLLLFAYQYYVATTVLSMLFNLVSSSVWQDGWQMEISEMFRWSGSTVFV